MDSEKIIEVKLKSGTKYFTISEIINEAFRIFCFEAPKSYDSGKLHDKIEHQIRRKLQGKKSYGEGKRNRKYSRNDVQHLLQVDLYDYFIKISKKQNEKRYNANKGMGRNNEARWSKNLKQIGDSEEARESEVETYRTQAKKWMASDMDYFIRERDGELTEEDVELFTKIRVEKKRREIFFEFLYESFFDFLISFDEALFREDLKHQLEGYDFPDEPIQVEATNRLKDNHNYYQVRLSPDKIKELLNHQDTEQPLK